MQALQLFSLCSVGRWRLRRPLLCHPLLQAGGRWPAARSAVVMKAAAPVKLLRCSRRRRKASCMGQGAQAQAIKLVVSTAPQTVQMWCGIKAHPAGVHRRQRSKGGHQL